MTPTVQAILAAITPEHVATFTVEDADDLARLAGGAMNLPPALVVALARKLPVWVWRHPGLGACVETASPDIARFCAATSPATAIRNGCAHLVALGAVRRAVAIEPDLLHSIDAQLREKVVDDALLAQLMVSAPRTLIRALGAALPREQVAETALRALSEAEKRENALIPADHVLRAACTLGRGMSQWVQGPTAHVPAHVVGLVVGTSLPPAELRVAVDVGSYRRDLGRLENWTTHEATWRWKFATPFPMHVGTTLHVNFESMAEVDTHVRAVEVPGSVRVAFLLAYT